MTNEALIHEFYSAFQQRDAAKMNACYSDDIVFSDPVFGLLHGDQVKAMWELLCNTAMDLKITFWNITDVGDEYYTCNWQAAYTFSQTGRKVINNVKAFMRIRNGKIIEHSDGFSLHKWSKQALGFSGWLLGWNGYFRKKIQNKAHSRLIRYMQQ
jgi:ketosteroid isomerase-like protein